MNLFESIRLKKIFFSQVSLLVNIASNYINGGLEGKRWGSAHASIVPYESFKTKDSYLTIGKYKRVFNCGPPQLTNDHLLIVLQPVSFSLCFIWNHFLSIQAPIS